MAPSSCVCILCCRSGYHPSFPPLLTSPTFLPYYLSPPSFLASQSHFPHLPPFTLTSFFSLLPPPFFLTSHPHISHLPPSPMCNLSLSSLLPSSSPPTLTSLTSLPHLRVTFLSLPLSQGGLVFICGTLDGLIQILSRRHNTEDLIATVMAVEPHSFIYKGRWVCITLHTPITPIKHATV